MRKYKARGAKVEKGPLLSNVGHTGKNLEGVVNASGADEGTARGEGIREGNAPQKQTTNKRKKGGREGSRRRGGRHMRVLAVAYSKP